MATTRTIPTTTGTVTPFCEINQLRNYGVTWEDGTSLLVYGQPDPEFADFIARYPTVIAKHRTEIAALREENAKLRAKLPPREPARLLGTGCVRQDPTTPAVLWLLNSAAEGWSAFGFRLDGWDELFRRFDVKVDAPARDAHGQYWLVTNRPQ